MTYKKTKLSEEQVDKLQRLIVKKHYMPTHEQFGHLEYIAQYDIDDRKYLFHKNSLMDVDVFELILEDNYICDCEKNYGKDCKYPEKYREGGCN